MSGRLVVLLTLFLGSDVSILSNAAIEARGLSIEKTLVSHSAYQSFRDGDVIFRRGRAVVSRIVLAVDDGSPYSHVGIIVREGENLTVVHATPAETPEETDRVKKDPIEIFAGTDRATAIAVYRVIPSEGEDLTDELGHKAAAYAFSVAVSGVPFDPIFDLADPSRVYCTELLTTA